MSIDVKYIGMLKVAVDSGPLTSGDSVRGIGVYVRELVNSLQKLQESKNPRIQIELITDHNSLLTDHYDIFHFTRFNPFFISVPFTKPKNVKFILTIYDLIPLIYPKHYPPGIKGKIRFLINKYLINKNVDAIITISETSKKDICRFLTVDPKKVFVTYLAPRPIFKKVTNTSLLYSIEVKYKLPERFALYVGDVNYNKNIPNLIKACEIAKIPLVIVGKQAKEIKKGKVDINHSELSHLADVDWKNVITPGFVEDGDLVKIYNLATVYIQPSFYEGFGLPVLEAVACGTPVVATKTQCLVEILGSEFEYVDSNDPKDMARGILNPNKNQKLSRSYSWGGTAEKTLEVYKNIL